MELLPLLSVMVLSKRMEYGNCDEAKRKLNAVVHEAGHTHLVLRRQARNQGALRKVAVAQLSARRPHHAPDLASASARQLLARKRTGSQGRTSPTQLGGKK